MKICFIKKKIKKISDVSLNNNLKTIVKNIHFWINSKKKIKSLLNLNQNFNEVNSKKKKKNLNAMHNFLKTFF